MKMKRWNLIPAVFPILAISVVLIIIWAVFFSASPTSSEVNGSTATLTDKDILSTIIRDYPNLISKLKKSPETEGYNEADLKNISFLNPVAILNSRQISDISRINEVMNTLHFPMINKSGEIFAIYSISISDAGLTSTLGKSFAPMLEKARLDGVEQAVIRRSGNDVFLTDMTLEYCINYRLAPIVLMEEAGVYSENLLNNEYAVLKLTKIDKFTTDRFTRVADGRLS